MTTRILALTTLAALLAACGSAPVQNSALDQARSRYNAAQADAQVSTLAPEELKRAADSLRIADQAWAAGGKPSTVDHLAYLTAQRVTIAQDTASSKASQAVTASAGAERDKMRLALRTSEADKAQAALTQSQQANAQKTSELAARTNEIDAAHAALNQSQQANAQKTAELAVAGAAAQNDKTRLGDLETQLKDLNAKKTDRGMVVTLGDVLFDSGKSQLMADSTGNLGKLASFFKRNPERRASIEGYTDSIGSANSNLDLSGRRASAVMTALVGLGVPADHLSTQAHGEEMPAASNDTASGRQMNRRVEIVFTPQADDGVTK